jgi:hypothetical protein
VAALLSEKRRWLPKRVSLYSPPTTKRLSMPASVPLWVASKRFSQKSWSCVISVWSRAMLAGATNTALSELRNTRFDWLAENSLRHDQPPFSWPVRRARSQYVSDEFSSSGTL